MDLSFLTQINESGNLSSYYSQFVRNNPKDLYFKALYTLLVMLLDDSLTLKQRLVSLFILLESRRVMDYVFRSAVVERIHASRYKVERALLQRYENTKDTGTLTPDQVLSLSGVNGEEPMQELCTVRPVVNPESVMLEAPGAEYFKYEAELLRPTPVFPSVHHSELLWLHPPLGSEAAWDTELQNIRLYEDLLQRATESELTQEQESLLLDTIHKHPHIPYRILSPSLLPPLVLHNPTIAVEVLQTSSNKSSYHQLIYSLLTMESSVKTMQVVSSLLEALTFTEDQMDVFLEKQMVQARSIEHEGRLKEHVKILGYLVERLVGKSLISEEMLLSLLEFLNEYSRIKEASRLYKLLTHALEHR